MFFPVKAPLAGTHTPLQALRLSLNSPVVAIESLPVGPAAAAIALHLGSPERPRVSVAIRSVQSRQLVFYSADEERAQFRTAGVAMDAALSFAESMGFLFDDDEVERRGADGPAEAARLWSAFTSGDPQTEVPELEGPELLLEEVAEPEPPEVALPEETWLEEVAQPTPGTPAPAAAEEEAWLEDEAAPTAAEPAARPQPAPVPPAPEPPAPLMMTKFRRAATALAEEAAPDARLRLLSRF